MQVWIYLGLSVAAMTCAITCLSILYDKHVDKTRAINSSRTPPAVAYGKNKKNTNENRLQESENKASPQQPSITLIKNSETISPLSLSPLPLATISPGKSNFISGQQQQNKSLAQADDTKTVAGITIDKVELVSNKSATASINKKKNSASVSSLVDNPVVTSTKISQSTAAKNNHYPKSMLNFIQEDIVTPLPQSEPSSSSASLSKQKFNSVLKHCADDKENNSPLATAAVTHHYHQQPSKPGHFSFTFLIGIAVFVSSHLTYHS